MAIGDIDGDLPLTNAARTKQTSFDQTNLPAQYRNQAAGPVSRADRVPGSGVTHHGLGH